ncbi:MAG: gamma-glutamyltransferase, partial [Burkholderiales bacterium]|nr:gamma-glutamyltransferase [Burkholderiales bacterium]
SMSPTLVFDKNSKKLQLAVGSPGGPAIIMFVSKVLIGVLDWNLTAQQAIALPNFGSRNGPTLLEQGLFSQEMIAALKAKGHTIQEFPMTSGLHGIQRKEMGKGEAVWVGGADPRREGTVMGD